MEPDRPRTVRRHEVAAGIIWDGARVLIARRQDGDHQGGRWEFPGGKRHDRETIEECLRREMREEIGIDVEVGPLWRALTIVTGLVLPVFGITGTAMWLYRRRRRMPVLQPGE